TRKPDGAAIQLFLCLEIGIFCNDIETARNRPLIDIGVHPTAEVLGNELVRALVLIDNLGLPSKVVGYHIMLKIFSLQLVSMVEKSVTRWQIIPTVHKLSPVNQSPKLINRLWGLVLFFQPLEECSIHVHRRNARGRGFVIDLIADDGAMISKMADDLADNTF